MVLDDQRVTRAAGRRGEQHGPGDDEAIVQDVEERLEQAAHTRGADRGRGDHAVDGGQFSDRRPRAVTGMPGDDRAGDVDGERAECDRDRAGAPCGPSRPAR
nr:hypothetical protein [Actinacidiphila glaucinigra]